MNHTKYLLKIVSIAFGVLAAAVIVFLLFRPHASTNKTSSGQPSNTSTSNPSQALEEQAVSGDGFSYQKPKGWAKLSKELLDSSAATSGIGLLPSAGTSKLPTATFTIKVAPVIPKDDKDLKNSVTTELKKLTRYQQTSIAAVTVGDNSGQRFIYTFGDKQKTKQQLDVIVHGKQTFFLLSSAADAEYPSHTQEFTTITNSFTFK